MTQPRTTTPSAPPQFAGNSTVAKASTTLLDPTPGNWDFSAAIDLIRSGYLLRGSGPVEDGRTKSVRLRLSSTASTSQDCNRISSLGNFDSIFVALGLPIQGAAGISSVPAGDPGATGGTPISEGRESRLKKSTEEATRPPLGKTRKNRKHTAKNVSQDDIKLRGGEAVGYTSVLLNTDRLVHSDSEAPKVELESQARRDVISSLLGTPPRTSVERSRTLPQEYKQLLPASIKPSKQFRNQSDNPSFFPSSPSTDKIIKLLNMLHRRFPEDTDSLTTMYTKSDTTSKLEAQPRIHVFIDISNILIGFHDTLKLRRGLSKDCRLPRQRLSFQKLSLILERGRPTTKRELVGSDKLESILEAQVIGYKTHILERVTKLKELTQRQKFFARLDGRQSASSGSEAEGTRPFQAQVRRVEQGVDEILHLKMSHSLLDTDTPSTIVLATGDAAEAEYSDGFLAMVERALERKWSVELVAFKGNMSRAYRLPEWMARWGDAFKIIELDDYADLLRLD